MKQPPARSQSIEIALTSPITGQQTVLIVAGEPGDAYRRLTLDARRRLQNGIPRLTPLSRKRRQSGATRAKAYV